MNSGQRLVCYIMGRKGITTACFLEITDQKEGIPAFLGCTTYKYTTLA